MRTCFICDAKMIFQKLRNAAMRQTSSTRHGFTCAAMWIVATTAGYATQVFVGNTVDFTPTGTTASWATPTADWNAFEASTYSHNPNLMVTANTIAPTSNIMPDGGIVFHFQSSTPTAMNVAVAMGYYFGNWSGHVYDVYFSDENNWSNLSTMVGGVWNGWDPRANAAGLDPNPLWTNIYTNHYWGGDGWHSLALPTTGTLTSTDGNFYIRVDMQATDGAGANWISTSGLTVTGTVVPEPATLALLTIGGITALRRKL